MISDSKRFIFTHNPKTAGTTAKLYLQHAVKDCEFHDWHYNIQELLAKNPAAHTFFKFGFVRNPFDRIVSAFTYSYQNMSDPDNYHWKAYPNTYPLIAAHIAGDVVESFRNFVQSEDFDKVFGKGWPVHFKPQCNFFSPIEMDYVGRFETFNHNFNHALDLLDIEPVRFKRRVNSSNNIPFPLFYNKNVLDRVAKKYEEDFKTFEYEETI